MAAQPVLVNEKVVHAHDKLLPAWLPKERTRVLTANVPFQVDTNNGAKCVVYWMQRDMRAKDNWALSYACHLADEAKLPLHVVHVLNPPPTNVDDSLPPTLEAMPMTERHGMFLLGGLETVFHEFQAKNVPMHMVLPSSYATVGESLGQTILSLSPSIVVCDFSPLRHIRQWMELQAAPVLAKNNIPMHQVDAHNVVPVWSAADKRQVGARTLRPRIHKQLSDFLQDFPSFRGNKDATGLELPEFKRCEYEEYLQMDKSVPAVEWARPGRKAGMQQFQTFVEQGGLKKFASRRNDPNEANGCSNLSPWLNHGHVSFQRCLMIVKKLNKFAESSASYIEEGLVRRELSDNYCYYSPNDYDQLEAAAGWAQETLQVHTQDPREYLYTLDELTSGQTHDDLWNAAQLQLVREGQMHGFLRMYWAKKILEWTESPLVALRTAQYFNDRYALDGKDPNGFVGVGWSIMGIHDMGWKERPIFGKIRYMNYEGCKRKFKVADFVRKYRGAAENAQAAVKRKGKESVEKDMAKGATKTKSSGTKKRKRS